MTGVSLVVRENILIKHIQLYRFRLKFPVYNFVQVASKHTHFHAKKACYLPDWFDKEYVEWEHSKTYKVYQCFMT